MAKRKQIVTARDHFSFDEEKHLPVPDFYKKYKTKFPFLAIIIDGIYGETEYDCFDCFQVTRLHCCTSQPRVLCMREEDSTKPHSRYITIPVKTSLKFRVIRSRTKASQPMDLTTILERNRLPILVNIDSPEEKEVSRVKLWGTCRRATDKGNILIIDRYEVNYLKMNCIYNNSSDLQMNDTACLLAFTKEITLTPILGFEYRTEDEFKLLERRLDKQVANHPEQYYKTDADQKWGEFILQPNQEDNGIPIPVKTLPVDVIRIIKSIHDGALPRPPPSPLSAVPTPRPRKSNIRKSPTQVTKPQRPVVDVDYGRNYDIKETAVLSIPKTPPKPTVRKTSMRVTDLNRHKDETCKHRTMPLKTPLSGLEVHKSVSGQKYSGYDNTKIGRAVVRPQLKVPEAPHDDDHSEICSRVFQDINTDITARDHFNFEEEKHLPVPDFYKKYKTKFPLLAIIIDGIYGETKYDCYDCFQVTRLHCCTSQARVLCMREEDSTKPDSRYTTIPVKTSLKFRVIRSRKKVSEPMDLITILERNRLPILVNLDSPEDSKVSMVKVGGSYHHARDIGNILIIDRYEVNYLKLNCIYNNDSSDLQMNDTACMLAFTKEITLTPILGFKYRTEDEFKLLQRRLDKQVANHPEQYDKTDGDPNWSEFNLQPKQEDNGIPIPVKILPIDVIRIIKSFQDEPLPPRPFSPLSTQSAGPPPRPQKPASLKSPTQATKLPIPEVDASNDSDYEIPEIDKFPIPKATPKLPDRTPSMRATKLKQTKGDTDKQKNMQTNKPLTGLEVHESVSSQKDSGYDNTKIGRAVVRPQQKVPEIPYDDVEYDVYCPVYEETQTDVTSGNLLRAEGISLGIEPSSSTPHNLTKTLNTKEQSTPNIPRSTSQSVESQFTGVGGLSIAEVSDVLKELNLGKYVDSFKRNTIDGEILNELDVEDFVNELGLKKLEAVRLSKYIKTGHVPK